MEKSPANPAPVRPRGEAGWTTLVGQQIGDFEILREIGRGGMGTVYQARQKSLDRIVALKVLGQGLAGTPTSVLRFQREAQAAARLHHSNIVPIHSLGDQDGIYYYAMELIHGENLHDYIDRERRERTGATEVAKTAPLQPSGDPNETVVMSPSTGGSGRGAVGDSRGTVGKSGSGTLAGTRFERIARLLASVADALDYAHENGIIHRDVKPHNLILGEDGRTHIFDFGLARVLEQPGVTMTGEFIGSPLYMSPEQILGGQVRVDKRTDIYSLGATLYEWLTLSPPFPGDTREQVISKIVSLEPPPPRERDALIPIDLETICLKCLEKDPNRRYPSAGHLRDDLLRFLDRETIKARRAGPLLRVRKFVLRNRVAAVAMLALAVITVLVAALVQQTRRSRGKERLLAEVQQAANTQAPSLQPNVEDMLRQRLASGETIGQQLAALAPELGQFLKLGSGGKTELDPLVQPLFKALLAWERQQESRSPASPVGPMEAAAQDLYLRALAGRDLAETERLAVEFIERHPNDLRGVMLAAAVCCGKRDFDCMMRQAAAVIAAEPLNADGYVFSGVGKILAGNPADAVNDLTRSAEIAPNSTWPLTLRGLASRQAGDFRTAIRDLSAAVRIAPENTLALLEKARLNFSLGDLESARDGLTRLIELDGNSGEAFELRGDCHFQLEQYSEAQADYQRAVQLGNIQVFVKLGLAASKLLSQDGRDGSPTPSSLPVPGEALPSPASSGPSVPPPPDAPGSSDAARSYWGDRLAEWSRLDRPRRRTSGAAGPWLGAWPR